MVEESAVPTEAVLHEVLTQHPSLVPAADLGLGRVVTVGFETGLASGNADLVLLDECGRVSIVEVKKEGNPDTRRVIAQLLDYAAALWGMSVDDFERAVLRPTRDGADRVSLREFVREKLVHDLDDPEDAADVVIEGLEETLRTGDFALVVAAPSIPAGVQRVIEYLNARGSRIYGLEVSYFAGEVDAFVPRLVVRPTIATRIAGSSVRGSSAPIDRETLLSSLPEQTREVVADFLDTIEDSGAELDWRENRVRVRVRGQHGPKVIAMVSPDRLTVAILGLKGIAPAHGERAAARMRELPEAKIHKEYAHLPLATAPVEQVAGAVEVAREYARSAVADALDESTGSDD